MEVEIGVGVGVEDGLGVGVGVTGAVSNTPQPAVAWAIKQPTK